MSSELKAYIDGILGLDFDLLSFERKLQAGESFMRIKQSMYVDLFTLVVIIELISFPLLGFSVN